MSTKKMEPSRLFKPGQNQSETSVLTSLHHLTSPAQVSTVQLNPRLVKQSQRTWSSYNTPRLCLYKVIVLKLCLLLTWSSPTRLTKTWELNYAGLQSWRQTSCQQWGQMGLAFRKREILKINLRSCQSSYKSLIIHTHNCLLFMGMLYCK